MAKTPDTRADLRALLDAVEACPPVKAVEVLATELARMVDAEDVSFLIADFTGDALIRFLTAPSAGPVIIGAERDDRVTTVQLPGTPYERALLTQQVEVGTADGATRLYAPVTDRGDALGVLELSLPTPPHEDTIAFVASAGHALAYVIIANRRHTDMFETGQRSVPFSLAAEIQRRLLPPAFTCEAAEFTVAGWLEPASDVGGDTFDYSLERDWLHLSISDAKGHTVAAAQLATLAVGSLRNTRRSHGDVLSQAHAANKALDIHAGDEDFVSALLLRVDLAGGVASVVNAGHPVPYMVRDGNVSTVALDANLPFGVLREATYDAQTVQLLPGDRLVLVTDGMLERNAESIDIKTALGDMVDLHPREVVHTFARAVIGATGGDLKDDATVLCIDWYGPPANGGARISSAGATQSLASGPSAA